MHVPTLKHTRIARPFILNFWIPDLAAIQERRSAPQSRNPIKHTFILDTYRFFPILEWRTLDIWVRIQEL